MMTRRNVYIDGNGSNLINVEGMGAYVPYSYHQEQMAKVGDNILARRVKELIDERDALVAQVKNLTVGEMAEHDREVAVKVIEKVALELKTTDYCSGDETEIVYHSELIEYIGKIKSGEIEP